VFSKTILATLVAIGTSQLTPATPLFNDAPQPEVPQVQQTAPATITAKQITKAVEKNIKKTTKVSAQRLADARFPGPFTAGVNQVIPFDHFGGDGMLTRLMLKASDNAPWSDNGADKNPVVLPLEGLGENQYFYEVDLEGYEGLQDEALLKALQEDGTGNINATVKVYGAKGGKADLSNVVATRQVTIEME